MTNQMETTVNQRIEIVASKYARNQSDFAKRSGILLCALDLTATDAKTTRIFNKLISSTIIHINNFYS